MEWLVTVFYSENYVDSVDSMLHTCIRRQTMPEKLWKIIETYEYAC